MATQKDVRVVLPYHADVAGKPARCRGDGVWRVSAPHPASRSPVEEGGEQGSVRGYGRLPGSPVLPDRLTRSVLTRCARPTRSPAGARATSESVAIRQDWRARQ